MLNGVGRSRVTRMGASGGRLKRRAVNLGDCDAYVRSRRPVSAVSATTFGAHAGSGCCDHVPGVGGRREPVAGPVGRRERPTGKA